MKTATDLIQEYKLLFDEGTITLDEYNYLKKHLLDQGDKEFAEEANILEVFRNQKSHEARNRIRNSVIKTTGGRRSTVKTVLKIVIPIVVLILILHACFGSEDTDSSDSYRYDYSGSYDYGSGYDSNSYDYDSYNSSDYDDWDTDNNGKADWHDVDTDNDGEVSSDEMNKYMQDWAEEESGSDDW